MGIREIKLFYIFNEIYGGWMYRGYFNVMNKFFGMNKLLVFLFKFFLMVLDWFVFIFIDLLVNKLNIIFKYVVEW